HGNLDISSELRHADDGIHYCNEVQQRRSSEPYRQRQVFVELVADRHQAKFTIRDEGSGFDFRSLPDPTDPSNLDKCGGRGLLLINAFMDEVHHNEIGNEITMIKRKSAS
ncbi:MAG: ATP-binding protein, partial [Aureliella sp.]